MKRALVSIFLIALIFTVVWAVANRRHLLSFPGIVSSYYSKEYCSCRFVVGHPPEKCHQIYRSFLNPSSVQEDTEKKTITASGLGQTNQARFLSEREGCMLVNQGN